MPSNLPPVPHRVQLLDSNGYLNPTWSDWFQKAFVRAGGNIADTNTELYSVDTVRIDDAAVTSAKLAASVAGNGLVGGAGTPLSVNVDGSTIEITADTLNVKDSGITAAKLAGSIPFAKLLGTDWTSTQAASGSLKLPSGIYIKWGVTGSISANTTTTVSFSSAFPAACWQVIAGVRDNSGGLSGATGHWGTESYTTSGFNLNNKTTAAYLFNWIAVGN